MRFEQLENSTKGMPTEYADRQYIKRCAYRGDFEIDSEILAVSVPKMVEKEDGTTVPMLSKTGQPIEDIRYYIPFKAVKDGKLYLTQTKSPLIRRLFKNLPVISEEKNDRGEVVRKLERVEGILRFTNKEYRYGDESLPVVTLESAEE